MRSLPKPREIPQDVFLLCVDGVSDLDRKKRYLTIRSDIVKAGQDYEIAAATGKLHTIAPANKIGGVVTTPEMVWLYENEMVRGPGRGLYDRLRTSAKRNQCPFCAQRTVSTLDHYLPQSKFPAFAVNAHNLVPSCGDCNKVKLAKSAESADAQTLHPYFDDYDRDEWLVAEVKEVKEKSPPVLNFWVSPPAHWSELQRNRVRQHMKVFELYTLYATHAAEELLNIRGYLIDLSLRAGTSAIQEQLADQAKSRRAAHLNSWQTAMYTALSGSQWFCTQGFRQIPGSS